MTEKEKTIQPGKDYIGIGVGALIVNEKNETLLLKRGKKAKNDAGAWCRPGGTIEYGEKATEAIKREVKEELGIDIEIVKFLGYTDHFVEGAHWISLGFLANIAKGEVRNMEPEKHDEVTWFPLDQLPEKMADPTRESLEEFIESANGIVE